MRSRPVDGADVRHPVRVGCKTEVARILQKLDLRDRVQAVIYAYENGVVAPGAPRA